MAVHVGDKRLAALVAMVPPASAEKWAADRADDEARIRKHLAAANFAKLSSVLLGPAYTSIARARQAFYLDGDVATAATELSRVCYATYLADWVQFVTIADPASLRARLEDVCEHVSLAIWLGYAAGLQLDTRQLAHLLKRGDADQVNDATYVDFCLRLCNAASDAAELPLLAPTDTDDIYEAIALPIRTSGAPVKASVLARALDARLQHAYASNVQDGSAGGRHYGGLHASVFPNELLACRRLLADRNQLESDVPLDSWFETLAAMRYDPGVESEALFREVRETVEPKRLR